MLRCPACDKSLDASRFETYVSAGRLYTRKICKPCKNRSDYAAVKRNGKYEGKKRRNRERRHSPEHRHKFVLSDARTFDRTAGLDNDLDVQFVEWALKEGCRYCGSTDARIGLDRIDNSMGHLKVNVVPCCTLCNFVRRDMPYEAWLLIVPGLAAARKQGLLQGWAAGIRRHGKWD